MLENSYCYSAIIVLLSGIGYLLFRLQTTISRLRQQAGLLQAIPEGAPAIIYIKDLQGRYLFINHAYQTLLHVTQAQVLGKTDAEIFSTEVAGAVRANDQKVQETDARLEFEEVAHLDNTLHTYFTVKFPIRDAEGKLYAIGGISSDVTARKQMEEALHQARADLEQQVQERTKALAAVNATLLAEIAERERVVAELRKSEERFTLAMQATNDGLWDTDLRTNEVYYSPRFKQLLGYPDHEQIDLATYIDPLDRQREQQTRRDHVKRKGPYDLEVRLQLKGGGSRWFHSRGQALWDAQGKAIRLAGAMRDIHERKLNEEQLRQGANVLAASASQIMASLTELLASSTQTASAIAQTSITVEEVKQTASIAEQKAKTVSSSAQQTVHVTQSGEQAVETAIAGLHRIHDQMESIAQSVIKLGEQSQAIGEIITNVSELAEQSNLLAVNAAIEAAKAGEQGRGFTVVAQEVRNLATQSKKATAQVRAILSDIQKATHVAVLVTEQGTKAVETGVQQSIEANQSIRVLSQNVTEAAQAVTQIAASSQQQLVGMDQVATAMGNIKQATTHNIEGTRQIEQAVQQLQGVGKTLQELVEQYTNHNGHGL